MKNGIAVAILRVFSNKKKKMDESALLSNIAMIICKDILIDQNHSQKKSKWHCSPEEITCANSTCFPLLEAADEAAESFYFKNVYRSNLHSNENYKQEGPTTSNKTGGVKRKLYTKEQTRGPANCLKYFNRKKNELNLLNEFETIEFESFLHMTKMSFLKTFQFFRHLLSPSVLVGGVPPQTVFSLSLWKLTTDEHFEEIAKRFKIARSECETSICQFWHIISDKYESYIKWPNSELSQQLQLKGFQKHSKLKIFPNLFGVLAIRRLDTFLVSENAEESIILQIVCDVDQKIIDCFVELEQDYTFDGTPMGQILALNENTMPKDCYLVGNKSFPLKPYLMTPFWSPCFRKEHEFNSLLEPALKLADDTLDIMAKRFNALYALEAKDLCEVRKILETICALHNLSVAIEDDYVERKRDVAAFNWTSNIKAAGCEQSLLGLRKRSDLVDNVMKLKSM